MTAVENEISIALTDGVHNEKNLPFLLTPERSSGRGMLLVHGFGATPHEMRPLAQYLCQKGHTTFAVRLPGHGTSPPDLAKQSYEAWLAAVNRGYQLLADRGLSIVGVGQSTGALLLLSLALSRPFEAQILLSPFLRLRHRLAPLAGLLRYLIPYQKRHLPLEEQAYYYQERPLKGVHQINRLRRRVSEELPRLTAPTLVLASEGDETVAPGTADTLFHKLGSSHKELHVFGQEVPHVLTTSGNPRQQDAFMLINEFLSKLSQGQS